MSRWRRNAKTQAPLSGYSLPDRRVETRSMCTITLILAASLVSEQNALAPPALGARVPDFSLQDTNGGRHLLSEFRGKKAIVVVFVGTECPIANLYFPTLTEMHQKYGAKGVRFWAINSNDQDALSEVAAHARERKILFPVLKDVDHRAADALGARRTPEAFLLDAGQVIRYR